MELNLKLRRGIKPEFNKAVLKLTEAFGISATASNDGSICTPKSYKNPGRHCREVRRWIRLIKSYGTHYVHKIRIGTLHFV